MFTKKKIIFKSLLGKEAEKYLTLPQPSKKVIPEWYKKMPNFHDKEDYDTTTVKKCMPFLDALSMGYTISTSWEMGWRKIKDEEGKSGVELSYPKPIKDFLHENALGLEPHSPYQFPEDGCNKDEMKIIVKILSPWVIKTPPGYSCLFVPPLNHSNLPFRPLSGVVDTDKYSKLPINFPSLPKKIPEEQDIKVIPAGTPIVMVIPFKREAWKMEIEYGEAVFPHESLAFFKRIIDNYKNMVWNKKDFD